MTSELLSAQVEMDDESETLGRRTIPDENFKIRSTLAQVLFSGVRYLAMLNVSLVMVYPSVTLPLWLNGNDGLQLDPVWSPYIVPVGFISCGIGILSSRLVGKWGRKPVIFISMGITEMGWIICYMAENIWMIIISRIISSFGVGIGLAVSSLIAESCEPRLRGLLESIAAVILALGSNLLSVMMQLESFRNIAQLNSIIPLLTIIGAYFIPETPLWLCTQGRTDEAKKALIWLRGWRYNNEIEMEFQQLYNYCKQNTNIGINNHHNSDDNGGDSNIIQDQQHTISADNQLIYKNSIMDNIKYLSKTEMLKPILLILGLLFFCSATPNVTLLYYLPLLLDLLSDDAPVELITIIFTSTIMISHILASVMVPCLGKRRLVLISMVGSLFGYILLGVYDLNKDRLYNNYSLLTTLLSITTFFNTIGSPSVIVPLLGEVFPLRGRILGLGVAAIAETLLLSAATVLFLPWMKYCHFYTIMFTYSGCYAVGYLYFNKYLIETEAKTLEQIQNELSSKTNSI